jgi:hypothetical protein
LKHKNTHLFRFEHKKYVRDILQVTLPKGNFWE